MISVIVPVYNEEASIQKTLSDIHKALEDYEHEIIVVNDGSTDSSSEQLKECNIKNFSLINHVENLGYGKSLYDGILAAKYNCIAIIDGDGSYPADKIKEFYKYYPQYDMVVGARKGEEYKKGIFKKPARKIFKYLVEYTTGRKIPDVNSGLRLFKKDIIIKHKDSLCAGFSFTTTLTLICHLNNYFVKYVPINYLKRNGKSKVKHFRDTLRTSQIIVEAIVSNNPIKIFLLLSVSNALFGLILELCNYFFLKSVFISVFSSFCIASIVPVFSLGLICSLLMKIYKSTKDFI